MIAGSRPAASISTGWSPNSGSLDCSSRAGDGRIGPGERRQVADIGKRLAVPGMALAGDADRHWPAVGKAELRTIAGGAGYVVDAGQAGSEEQIAPELDLRRRHRVVARDRRRRHPVRELP